MTPQKTDRDWAQYILDLAVDRMQHDVSYADAVAFIEDILDERDAAIIRGFREKWLRGKNDN